MLPLSCIGALVVAASYAGGDVALWSRRRVSAARHGLGFGGARGGVSELSL